MSPEPGQTSPPPEGADEMQLCLGCMFPNDPTAHFCSKCGAPLTSYAATGPFESLFAQGHVYRQAAERPRSMIVVLGIWLIFGVMTVAGFVLVFPGRNMGKVDAAYGAVVLAVSVVLLWKTTRNYLTRAKSGQRRTKGS